MSISHQSKIRFTEIGKPTVAIVAKRRDGALGRHYILGFRTAIKSDGDERGKISIRKTGDKLDDLDVVLTFESKDNIDAVISALQALKDDDLWERLKESNEIQKEIVDEK